MALAAHLHNLALALFAEGSDPDTALNEAREALAALGPESGLFSAERAVHARIARLIDAVERRSAT